jgi:hypothetical protein
LELIFPDGDMMKLVGVPVTPKKVASVPDLSLMILSNLRLFLLA